MIKHFRFGKFTGAPGPPGKRGKRGKKGDSGDTGSPVSSIFDSKCFRSSLNRITMKSAQQKDGHEKALKFQVV